MKETEEGWGVVRKIKEGEIFTKREERLKKDECLEQFKDYGRLKMVWIQMPVYMSSLN